MTPSDQIPEGGDWNLHSALQQVQACRFECEAGPLDQSTAFIWLSDVVRRGPKYALGQMVFYEVSAEVEGIKLSKWCAFEVVGVFMGADTERQTYTYHISQDPPRPWHHGGKTINAVSERLLRLSIPEPAQ